MKYMAAAATVFASRNHPPTKKKAFVPKPYHERILEALYRYHFLTTEQVTRLFYSRGSLTTVRALLYELALKKYVMFLYLPRPTPLGSVPKIYTLARRGINYLKTQGYDVPMRFHPCEQEEKSYLFLRHTLAVNDALIAATTLEKQYPAITLYACLHERVLKRREPITVSYELLDASGKQVHDKDGKLVLETIRLIPDAFLDFRIDQPDMGKTYRYCVLLELDRATIEERNFRKKVRGLLAFIKSRQCSKHFGTKLPAIAFTNAVGGIKRREQMRRWTEAELKKSKEPHFWTELFMFTNLSEEGAIDPETLFLSPVWYLPFQDKPTVLFSAGSR
jgi:hypothetical protein